MRKFIFSVLAIALLTIGYASFAATKIIVKEKPIVLQRSGEVYIVPEGTATTVRYYTYTDSGKDFVCTVEKPTELVDVDAVMLNVRFGGDTRQVNCYPSSNFVIE